MGTNYYVIQRNDYKKYMSMLDHINTINFDKLKEELDDIIYIYYSEMINAICYGDIYCKYKEDINKIKEIISEETSNLKTSLALEITPYEILGHRKIHIGKSSAGWLFCFQYQNNGTCKWNNYKEVFDWLYKNTIENEEYYIIDEYNEIITYQDFKNKVDEKQKDPKNLANPENFYYCDNVGGYRFALGDFG